MRFVAWRPGGVGLVAACLTCLVLPGAGFAQSMLGNAGSAAPTDQNIVVVPPAPPIVSAPPAAPMPQVVTPQSAPPGLVQTPLPPPNMDNGQAGTDGTAPVDHGEPAATASAAAGAVQAPAAAAPGAADTAASLPPPAANNWVPEHTARIGLLDKVDGGASTVSVPVGGQTDAGDLRISVLACETRPPGEIPDDAILVSIEPLPASTSAAAAGPDDAATTDAAANNTPTGQIFRGWMIRSIPGATVVGDASETLRVVGCS